MKKERTPAQKLATYKRSLREIWHRSPIYWEVYNRAKKRPGVLGCEKCGRETDARLIEMDHVEPVTAPGQDPADIALWAFRLNAPASKIQALCEDCHKQKTSEENRKRVKREHN